MTVPFACAHAHGFEDVHMRGSESAHTCAFSRPGQVPYVQDMEEYPNGSKHERLVNVLGVICWARKPSLSALHIPDMSQSFYACYHYGMVTWVFCYHIVVLLANISALSIRSRSSPASFAHLYEPSAFRTQAGLIAPGGFCT